MSEFQLVSFTTIGHYERMVRKAATMQEELLSVSAVARRLGVAPATLRTWDRRYGLGPSIHESGEHRRYCTKDLAKLMLMRRLISAGVSPSDAAEQAKTHKGEIKLSAIVREFEVREDVVAGIDKALLAFDIAFVEETLRHELDLHGVEITWHEIIVPTLIAIGEAWQSSGKGIEIEHAFTEVLKKILRERTLNAKTSVNTNPVILASIGEEQHSLPLHALEAALAEMGIRTHFLGARTPFEAIAATLPRIAPPAIFLWATFTQKARPEYFQDLPSIRPAPRILLGGPGWEEGQCQGATVVLGIGNACDEIASAVGVAPSR
jgi:MerR family transcriptional regulator, light-induced transcriptional regulator